MKERAQRVRRSSINGTRNILNVRGKKEGFVYRFVNDTGDRVQQFKEMGYEVVTDSDIQVGDKRVASATSEGSPVAVSAGQGLRSVLMAQKQEWYDEDQQAKQEQITELEKSLKNPALEGSYGGIQVEKGR